MDNSNDAQLQEYRRSMNRLLAQVMEYCDMLLQQQPASEEELMLLAVVCHLTRRHPKAVDAIERLRQVNPTAAAAIEALVNGVPVAANMPTAGGAPAPANRPAAGVSGSNLTFTVGGVSFEMVWVEGGTFQMGSNDGERNEKPVHSVTLDDYYIGKTQVTQALWEAVMGSNPSKFKGSDNPVENVSWEDCQEFVKKLSSLTGRRFSLPTEAQWEYAARGGSKSRGYRYSGSNDIDSVAWYNDNSGNRTHPVAQKQPNELGLYDMSGNVCEWCQDWYDNRYYANSPTCNPVNDTEASDRVYRGGCYYIIASSCRSAIRNYYYPDNWSGSLGLRLVLLP